MSIVNTDQLEIVLTSYGLSRVSQCLATPSENINLSKMKFGQGKLNATSGEYEYYEPSATQTELESLISSASFPLVEKKLLEDGITISLHSVIPETFGGYDIREVGIYETINGIDYLFAIGVYQPIVKPSADYNYYMTIDFYIFLKSATLADVYDQIILDSATQLVTETDLENLMRTILFVEGNLETQIESNSVELGYNRVSQLHDKIVENEKDYSYYTAYSEFTDLLSYVGSDRIFSYWVFNYPRRSTATNAVIDISSNHYNLNTNKPINQYTRKFEGIASMLDFTGTNYFALPADVELSLLNSEKSEDISFSMMFVVNPADHDEDLTLLAKSNYAVGTNVFEVTEKADRSLEVKLFADSANYISYTSAYHTIPNESHALVISYNKDTKEMTAYANGKKISLTKTITGTYAHMNATNPILYAYVANPTETIYANSASAPTTLYNLDGTPYLGTLWTISSNNVYYSNVLTTQTGSAQTFTQYAWTYTYGSRDYTIWTKTTTISSDTKLYNADFSEYTGTEFVIVQSGSSYIIQYNNNPTSRDTAEDISATRYPFVYTSSAEVIWTNRTFQDTLYGWTYQGNTIYTKTTTLASTTPLYNANGTTYTGSDFAIGTLYAWTYDGHTIYTKTTTLAQYTPMYNEDGSAYSGTDFTITLPAGSSTYIIQYQGSATSRGTDIYIIQYQSNNTSRGTDIITKPTQLFNSNGTLYEGTDWVIGSSSITYKTTYTATYDSTKNVQVPTVGLTSYITDSDGNLYNYINSYINVISVIKTGLSEVEIRALSLTLTSTLGKNPCMVLGE